MKKIVNLILAFTLTLGVVLFAVGCGDGGEVKLGLGVYSEIKSATDADGGNNGEGSVEHVAVAVLVDEKGKILNCKIDSMENNLKYTSAGEYLAAGEFKTKLRQGDSYGMKEYAGAALEWYEQVARFEELVIGKKITDVKALVASGGKGNNKVTRAGCTIVVSGFVKAIENAVENATKTGVTKDSDLEISIISVHNTSVSKNATATADGATVVDTAFQAKAINTDSSEILYEDSISVIFAFDKNGASKTDENMELTSVGNTK